MTEVEIAILLNRIKELDEIIHPMILERSTLERQLLEATSEFKVGDIIIWGSGKRKGRVASVKPWGGGKPLWKVVNIRKDGTDGASCTVTEYDNPAKFIPVSEDEPVERIK